MSSEKNTISMHSGRGSSRDIIEDLEEKKGVEVDVIEVDLRDRDEALKLVGLERTAEFSEEYYKKLRRKLVCQTSLGYVEQGFTRSTGYGHSPTLCSCILHAVPVRMLLESLDCAVVHTYNLIFKG